MDARLDRPRTAGGVDRLQEQQLESVNQLDEKKSPKSTDCHFVVLLLHYYRTFIGGTSTWWYGSK